MVRGEHTSWRERRRVPSRTWERFYNRVSSRTCERIYIRVPSRTLGEETLGFPAGPGKLGAASTPYRVQSWT